MLKKKVVKKAKKLPAKAKGVERAKKLTPLPLINTE
jgi:hypothetical protein